MLQRNQSNASTISSLTAPTQPQPSSNPSQLLPQYLQKAPPALTIDPNVPSTSSVPTMIAIYPTDGNAYKPANMYQAPNRIVHNGAVAGPRLMTVLPPNGVSPSSSQGMLQELPGGVFYLSPRPPDSLSSSNSVHSTHSNRSGGTINTAVSSLSKQTQGTLQSAAKKKKSKTGKKVKKLKKKIPPTISSTSSILSVRSSRSISSKGSTSSRSTSSIRSKPAPGTSYDKKAER